MNLAVFVAGHFCVRSVALSLPRAEGEPVIVR